MRVCIAQIDTTVGDFEGNVAKVLDALSRLGAGPGDVVVFPELTLTGYPPLDLLERPSFVEANLRALDRVVASVKEPIVIVGFVEPNKTGVGKPLFNAAAVVHDGRVMGIHRKVRLPTYDVFDEARWFEPGPQPGVIAAAGQRLAVTICEDMWGIEPWRSLYRKDPVEALAAKSPDILINLSASPFHAGKQAVRVQAAQEVVRRHNLPVVYVNLVGGNDGIIFDGGSFVLSKDGGLVARVPSFQEVLASVSLDSPGQGMEEPEDLVLSVIAALCLGLRDFLGKLGLKKVVVGLSGGIDSAVVAALAARALQPEAVTCVSMPSRYTSEETRRDAATIARNLGVTFLEVPIDPIFDAYLTSLAQAFSERPGGVTEENLQARIRGAILMAISNRTGALVLNTGNKSELAVGYCTLYGDMVGGLAVIGDLTKTMVYAVARAMNREHNVIPESVMTRPPSAELRPGQKDEDSIPPYALLDPIVQAIVEDGLDGPGVVARGFPPSTVAEVNALMNRSEFKRYQAPPVLRVTPRAFGVGRRYPIVHRFKETF